jgi:hypothetical protein
MRDEVKINQEKNKKIEIKRIRFKLDTKIKWNKILRDKIEEKSTSKGIKSEININKKNEDQN